VHLPGIDASHSHELYNMLSPIVPGIAIRKVSWRTMFPVLDYPGLVKELFTAEDSRYKFNASKAVRMKIPAEVRNIV
jgi:hypothetical protein